MAFERNERSEFLGLLYASYLGVEIYMAIVMSVVENHRLRSGQTLPLALDLMFGICPE